MVYLDDILLFSPTFDEHLKRLRDVFQRLREANLKLQPKKCAFVQRSAKFLGHVVSSKGIGPDPDKVAAVQRLASPVNKAQLRSFLGLSSYYRRFIKDYARLASPLTMLLREGQCFQWGSEQQQAFAKLKQCLITSPILDHPDWERPFILQTDASGSALGAVLAQVDEQGRERVIHYLSRALTEGEQK